MDATGRDARTLRTEQALEDGPVLRAARKRRRAVARAMIAAREQALDQEERRERIRR